MRGDRGPEPVFVDFEQTVQSIIQVLYLIEFKREVLVRKIFCSDGHCLWVRDMQILNCRGYLVVEVSLSDLHSQDEQC